MTQDSAGNDSVYRIAIVDDNRKDAEQLKGLVEKYFAGSAKNGMPLVCIKIAAH